MMKLSLLTKSLTKGITDKYRPYWHLFMLPPLLLGSIQISIADTSPIVGGSIGTEFADPDLSNQRLTSVNLRVGSWISAIQGITNNGNLPIYGGTGGTVVNVTWPADEYLVRVYGTYNNSYIGQINFVTNTGRVLGPYGTPTYPLKTVISGYYFFVFPIYSTVPDYSNFDFTVPTGNELGGLAGRFSSLINAFGVRHHKRLSYPLPLGAINCGRENASCILPAGMTATVYFGANGKYFYKTGVTGSTACNNTNFGGDPVKGTVKSCAYVATDPNNLILNGSFEVPTGYYDATSGWIGLNDLMEINTATAYGVSGASGTQVIELDSNRGGNSPVTGFYQNVVTQANQAYTLSVDVAARAGQPLPTNSVEVWWRNQYLGTIEPPSTVMANYSGTVIGSGGTDRLEFREQLGDDDSFGGIIDNVKLVKNLAPPTPVADLSVNIAQPAPALKANAMSEVEVTVSNTGNATANAPINVSFTMPTNVSAPLKFTRVAEHWLCKTTNQAVACSYDLPLAGGANSVIRIPVTPAANTLGTTPAPFVASVAAASGETVLGNNGPLNMTPTDAVTALTLTGVADPLGIYSLPLLDATTIPKYALPMPNLLAPAYKHTANTTAFAGSDFYTLDIKQVKTQILPPGYPATNVFAYGDPARPDTFTYPAHSIEARSTNVNVNTSRLGKPSKVQYQNTSTAAAHVLDAVIPSGISTIVDRSLTGANTISPTNLREEIRTVAHLHGARNVEQQSNGHPEAWRSPTGQVGRGASTNPTVPFNASPFNYSNNQESSMLWYHDEALGLSRLNVYAGLAGLYTIRDDNEMAMINSNKLPSGAYEVPLVLQDRMFRADGSLAYPDIDVVAPSPSWVKEFSGDVMVVNGVAWPYFQVEPRKYRFRVLNASNMRFYNLSLQNSINTTAAINFQVIGNDGGFLNAPVDVSTLVIGPGERYDIIVDFAALNGANITLKNAAGVPFSGSTVIGGESAPVPGLHDQMMQFRVNLPLSSTPIATLPAALRTPIVGLVPTVATPRKLSMSEVINSFSRVKPLLGITSQGPKLWTDPVTEIATNGAVETWEIYNNTPNTHAIHVHTGTFEVVERQLFNAVLGVNGELTNITFPSAAIPVLAVEKGWKDTVVAYPSPSNNPGVVNGDIVSGVVTRVRMKFETPGQFLWHCQILEHQDHEMQRPMTVL